MKLGVFNRLLMPTHVIHIVLSCNKRNDFAVCKKINEMYQINIRQIYEILIFFLFHALQIKCESGYICSLIWRYVWWIKDDTTRMKKFSKLFLCILTVVSIICFIFYKSQYDKLYNVLQVNALQQCELLWITALYLSNWGQTM